MSEGWLKLVTASVSGAAIVLVALFGLGFVSADVERQTDVQFVNMAITILAEEVTDPTKQLPLRLWAIDIINEHSQVEISGQAKAILLKEAFAFEWNASRVSFERAVDAWRAAVPPPPE